jgi:hypothetical protein
METPMPIAFNFPLEGSSKTIPVAAVAELELVEACYVVHSFEVLPVQPHSPANSFLPAQKIKKIKERDTEMWVHKDSEKPTVLSIVIGEAIDKKEKELE